MILAYSCDPCPQSMNSNACVREIEFKLSISLTSHPSRSAYSYIMRVAAMPRSHLPQRHESGAHPRFPGSFSRSPPHRLCLIRFVPKGLSRRHCPSRRLCQRSCDVRLVCSRVTTTEADK